MAPLSRRGIRRPWAAAGGFGDDDMGIHCIGVSEPLAESDMVGAFKVCGSLRGLD